MAKKKPITTLEELFGRGDGSPDEVPMELVDQILGLEPVREKPLPGVSFTKSQQQQVLGRYSDFIAAAPEWFSEQLYRWPGRVESINDFEQAVSHISTKIQLEARRVQNDYGLNDPKEVSGVFREWATELREERELTAELDADVAAEEKHEANQEAFAAWIEKNPEAISEEFMAFAGGLIQQHPDWTPEQIMDTAQRATDELERVGQERETPLGIAAQAFAALGEDIEVEDVDFDVARVLQDPGQSDITPEVEDLIATTLGIKDESPYPEDQRKNLPQQIDSMTDVVEDLINDRGTSSRTPAPDADGERSVDW